jgi:tetratricopeptide (TPR) repeat protein
MIALNSFHYWYDVIVYDVLGIKREHTKYIKPVGISLLVALLALGGFYFYAQRSETKNQEALKVFNDCLAEYEKAVEGKASWAEVDTLCENGFNRYRSSTISPYLLAIRIDSLLAQQKNVQALELATLMISQLPSSSPLYNLYKTKYALLQIDAADQSLREQGLQALQQLAVDAKNTFNDVALYYLGLYYEMQNNHEKAKEFWNKLVALGISADKQSQSPWAAKAQEKLENL